jgi:SlyX protein
MEDRQELEERLAHLERIVADLSDVVARQDRELAVLTRRVGMLMQREAERELAAAGGVVLADETPPHW